MEDASGSDEVRPLEDEDDGAINLFDDDSFLKGKACMNECWGNITQF